MPAASSVFQSIRAGFTKNTQDVGTVAVASAPSTSSPVLDQVSPSASSTLHSQLDILDEVLLEAEQHFPTQLEPTPPAPVAAPMPDPMLSVAQAVPAAVAQATNTLNPATPTFSAKELAQPATLAESAVAAPVDLGGGYQLVEEEHKSELSPEVDGYIQEVKDHQEQLPQEIVIADGSMQLLPPAPVLQKVVVLPISPEVEQVGVRKNPKFSVRWLVEWSRRLMKMFSGKIVYTQETT